MEVVDERLTYEERIAALSVGGAALDLTEPRPLKLTVDDLVLLDRRWQDDDHKSTELIDGRIYFTPARYRPRAWVAQEIWKLLWDSAAVIAPNLFVGMRGSIQVSPYDLPLPDIVLTSDRRGEGFIPAVSVSLVVEVADTTLDFYMSDKMRLYARGGILEYWTVDVQGRCIHRWSRPIADGYAAHDHVEFGRSMASATIEGLTIHTSIL